MTARMIFDEIAPYNARRLRVGELKSILGRYEVVGIPRAKPELLEMLSEYMGASTDENTIELAKSRDRDWLSKFKGRKLKRMGEMIGLDLGGSSKGEMVESLYNGVRGIGMVVEDEDFWLIDGEGFKDVARVYGVRVKNPLDYNIDLRETREIVLKVLKKEVESVGSVKYYEVYYTRFVKDGIKNDAVFKSEVHDVFSNYDLEGLTEPVVTRIIEKVEKFQKEGSGWVFDRVLSHKVNVINYRPFQAGGYIPLPKFLSYPKNGLVNIRNYDNECFRWCHVRLRNMGVDHRYLIGRKDLEIRDRLNYSGVKFPVSIKDYEKIALQNSINVNVFYIHEESGISPLKLTKTNYDETLDLLMLEGGGKSHYVLIADFDRFMYKKTKRKCKKYFCRSCLQCFTSERVLKRHRDVCLKINGTQKIEMPRWPNDKVFFKNYSREMDVPFVIYADFEALNIPKPKKFGKSSEVTHLHECCSFAYKVVCRYNDKYTKPVVLYRGANAVEKLLESLLKEYDECMGIVGRLESMRFDTKKNTDDYENAKVCHICNGEFVEKYIDENGKTKSGKSKVWDHCHMTGEYRGAAHQDCNLGYKLQKRIPVFFHNLRGYDSHFIIPKIDSFSNGQDIKLIPNDLEKYLTFSLKQLDFRDSFQFMSFSLDELSKNLDDHPYTRSEMGELYNLVKRKGVYPYDYMDSWDRFEETTIPPIEGFYNSLNCEDCDQNDYEYAVRVWRESKCKNIGDYHDMYLRTDVLLLADVFEKFRITCKDSYGLDPAHYFSSPGLSWDAMLKCTGVEMDLITDSNMHMFIERASRGGVSGIVHRHAQANNPLVTGYNPSESNTHLVYLDANNLYGWAMSRSLPVGELRWMNPESVDLNKYTATSTHGLFLEVDLDYPPELHDLHNDYPLAPETKEIKREMLSPYSKEIAERNNKNLEITQTPTKLLCTLEDKRNYVLHHENLKLYMRLGMRLVKIHRVVKFRQEPWLARYIEKNTDMRKGAKNAFEKDFYKLMNNSVFGKTIENIRKRVDVKLCTSEKRFLKYSNRPSYVRHSTFTKSVSAIEVKKSKLLLNKPIYVGVAILDISKICMYEFHYGWTKKRYGDKAKLLFTDTDSLMYRIETGDVYKDMYDDKSLFDLSENGHHKDLTNKKVLGKMKDETKGVPILGFVGLGSKMYSFVTDNRITKLEREVETRVGTEIVKKKVLIEEGLTKKAKGINKSVVKQEIKYENYKQVLLEGGQMRHTMNKIANKKHVLTTNKITKISLSAFDDKRWILDDGISSYAYGHHIIPTGLTPR